MNVCPAMGNTPADGACETPLADLLNNIPADARMTYEHDPTHHSMIPVGVLARKAAAELARLSNELEHERVRLAGCGVIAMSNTHDSLARHLPPVGSYGHSASADAVAAVVLREIAHRERVEALRGLLRDCLPELDGEGVTIHRVWAELAEEG